MVDSFPGGATESTVQEGSLITYTIAVHNDSGYALPAVDVVDSVPQGTEFVSAFPVPLMANQTMTWHVAPFANEAMFAVSFTVRVLPGFEGTIRNVAMAYMGDVDWTSNEVFNVTIPTSIQLVSLRATREGQSVAVRWQIASELNTFGYRIYRSTTAERASATMITGGTISATGSGTGASYEWVDTGAPAGTVYYWLEEIETTGAVTEYGPVPVGPIMTHRIFFPMIR